MLELQLKGMAAEDPLLDVQVPVLQALQHLHVQLMPSLQDLHLLAVPELALLLLHLVAIEAFL